MKKVTSVDAYDLFHRGMLALSQVEANGIRIDTDYLDRAINDASKRVAQLEQEIKDDDIYRIWKKTYGDKLNFDSDDEVRDIVFNKLGYEPKEFTPTGKAKVSKGILKSLKIPFFDSLIEISETKNARGTFLLGIKRELVDGFIHPCINLHLVETFRSSCNSPNFQNQPKRNNAQAKLVRRAFIAREGHQLGEIDFKSMEVRVGYCYHKDPAMYDYLCDPTKDMHRDMAEQLFMLDHFQINSNIRNNAKGNFVFSEFYGNYYINVAQDLWEDIQQYETKTKDGTPLLDHLRHRGITRLGACNPKKDPQPGTFESHVKEVESDFWNNRFPVYSGWKKRWYKKYLEQGYIEYLTGFVVRGLYSRNEIINYPVQGAAFHCLLWTLIELQSWLTRNKMRTKIIGQIHDSILLDIHEDELQDVLTKCKRLISRDLSRAWSWITVPMEAEAEVSPPGGSWYDKKAWIETGGYWGLEVRN